MMQIQELPDQNLNESAMNCETSDLLLNSEQNLMLQKQNCNIPTESIGETFVDNVQKPNNFDNEKWVQSSISTLEPVPVSMKAESTTQYPDKRHLKAKEFRCYYCTSRFTEQKNLARHVAVKHHNFTTFSCIECKKHFASKQILKLHLKSVHKEKFHQIGPVTESLSQSNLTNQKKIFLCSKCNQQFSSKESCLVHVKICKGCPKVNNMTGKNLHKDKKFACFECGEKFEFQSNLANHKLIAHKEAIFDVSCPKCRGAFANQIILNQHIKICEAPSMNVGNLPSLLQNNFNYKNTSIIKSQQIVKPSSQLILQNANTVWNQPGQIKLTESFTCKHCSRSFANHYMLV